MRVPMPVPSPVMIMHATMPLQPHSSQIYYVMLSSCGVVIVNLQLYYAVSQKQYKIAPKLL